MCTLDLKHKHPFNSTDFTSSHTTTVCAPISISNFASSFWDTHNVTGRPMEALHLARLRRVRWALGQFRRGLSFGARAWAKPFETLLRNVSTTDYRLQPHASANLFTSNITLEAYSFYNCTEKKKKKKPDKLLRQWALSKNCNQQTRHYAENTNPLHQLPDIRPFLGMFVITYKPSSKSD